MSELDRSYVLAHYELIERLLIALCTGFLFIFGYAGYQVTFLLLLLCRIACPYAQAYQKA